MSTAVICLTISALTLDKSTDTLRGMMQPAAVDATNLASTRFFREIIDLSHELYNGMPNITGRLVSFFPLETHANLRTWSSGKYGMEGRMIVLPEHTGTHLDVPRHCDPDGPPLEQVPLEQLVLPGHLLDFTSKSAHEAITGEDFERAIQRSGRPLQANVALLAWTGVDKRWAEEGFITERPYLPAETAQWLVDHKVTLFGTDLIGVDHPDEWWWPTHEVMLKAGMCMVQQLCNLDRLVGKEFLFVALPITMRGGTGCPVRAIALVV